MDFRATQKHEVLSPSSQTALGQLLTGASNAEVLSATHGGADIQELIALLQRLLEAPK